MSQLLYNRKVQVSVGIAGQPALLIEGLRIVFAIEKTLEKTPNNTQIEIYNLSAASRAVFEQKNSLIRVSAGYGDQTKDIFIGDIATVVTKKTGSDIITSVEAADGLLAYQSKESDRSFAPGSKVGTIIDRLVQDFGLVRGEIQGLNENDEYLNGVSFSGKVRDHIENLLGKQPSLDWSIQDGRLQILPKSKGSVRPAVLLNSGTGLIGSPFKRVVLNVDYAKKKEGKDVENGVQIKSLLNHELEPGRLIALESTFVTGTFKAVKVKHTGDTFAVTYYSEVEAVIV